MGLGVESHGKSQRLRGQCREQIGGTRLAGGLVELHDRHESVVGRIPRHLQLEHKWMPHLAVASGNGGTHTAWNYSACSGLTCTPVNSGQRIASGVPCSMPGGVATTQPAPNLYYSVAGQTSTTGAVLPSGTYSPCVAVPTPLTGW